MRVLVLFAHPRMRQSVVQRAMLAVISGLDNVTVRDLYAEYPDFMIDGKHERDLLLDHDIFVLQHPMYWYSSPAIIKEWLDITLEEGWAYGKDGNKLYGKYLLNAVSTGGPQEAYHEKGRNRFPISSLLAPFDQTAYLCGMAWLEPFVIHAGRKLEPATLSGRAEHYRDLIIGLRDGRVDPMHHIASGYALPQGFKDARRLHAHAS